MRAYHGEVTGSIEAAARLGIRLAAARERAGYTEEEVALLLGQPRPVVSNWEHGVRRPNPALLAALASVYRVGLDELLGAVPERPRVDFERLMFRAAESRLDARGKYEIERFLAFLDAYGDVLGDLGEPPGMMAPPLVLGKGFASKDDVRRKAEEARQFFRIGSGPVGDLRVLADLQGVTLYQAPLGADMRTTVSGAFLRHDSVGAAILLNSETSPGRRQFTLAHELAHALFHADGLYVGFFGRRERDERFADEFAAEFLVPTQSLRRAVETLGVAKVEDPAVVVYLQRLFGVSYAMMLVRLEASNLIAPASKEQLQTVQPVHFAERLGYPTGADEWGQDPDRWGLARFPPRFLRLVRTALAAGKMSLGGVASMTGLAEEDIEELVAERPSSVSEQEELAYLAESS